MMWSLLLYITPAYSQALIVAALLVYDKITGNTFVHYLTRDICICFYSGPLLMQETE